MEKVGILVVSYGSREAAMIDAFSRSENYSTEIYVADRQKNPFNIERAAEHIVIPDLNLKKICEFAEKRKERIDFGIVGPEKPIIEGIRDFIEKETSIPIICPTKKYALEESKIAQRHLFQEVVPGVNPKFKVFNPRDYGDIDSVKKDVFEWLNELDNQVAVKPNRPVAGKGVGIWGDHFSTREQLFDHFRSNYKHGSVIIEEKVEGEESSFQAFCDGKHLVPLPETRDYKRAFEDDLGPNTGGMGSYKDVSDWLPFMTRTDKEQEIEIAKKIFEALRSNTSNQELLGIPLYLAFIHTKKGPKILENNSRPGDPEMQNILPILKDDFVDVCLKMLEGNLTRVRIEKKATVVVYKVPISYGGFKDIFPEKAGAEEAKTPLDLGKAYNLAKKNNSGIRIYPGSVEIREDKRVYALASRAVCAVGSGEDIARARENSLKGMEAIRGGALWYRNDIASSKHISKSIEHMKKLRASK